MRILGPARCKWGMQGQFKRADELQDLSIIAAKKNEVEDWVNGILPRLIISKNTVPSFHKISADECNSTAKR